MKVTWLDRVLISIAPRWGVRRVQARHAVRVMRRSYEATGGGRRTAGWRRNASDANNALGPSLAALREFSRDLRRNNGWAKNGVRVIVDNTVGWGIQGAPVGLKPRPAARVRQIWKDWAGSTSCDIEGRSTFAGIQRAVMATIVESGEALILREVVNSKEAGSLPVPIQIRVLEPDHLDTSRDVFRSEDGSYTLQGIEFDARGRRVAYWLFPQHPGSSLTGGLFGGRGFQSRRVPAADVIHVYHRERPGQVRGEPWLSAAINKLHDFDDYEDAVLMQQKIAACFGAFVTDVEGSKVALGEESTDDPLIDKLEPGHVQYLAPGQDIKFSTPPTLPDHKTFTSTNLHRIAAALGVTYEDLTKDYSQSNYSSARMARLSHYAHVYDWQWNMLVPLLCDRVWRWVMQDAVDLGLLTKAPAAQWSAPAMPMLDPDKEGLAYQRLVRSGAMTLFQMIRERGDDPDAHLEEIAEANQRLDELGIILDSDPRRTSSAGQQTPAPNPGTAEQTEEEGGVEDEGAPAANGRLLS